MAISDDTLRRRTGCPYDYALEGLRLLAIPDTEERRTKLRELGLTDELILMAESMLRPH